MASSAGARLAKGQHQKALPGQLWFAPWTPGALCIGFWNGDLLLDRVGQCGSCPCAARVEATPDAAMIGLLDAVASVDAVLKASISAGGQSSATGLRYARTLDAGAAVQGWWEQLVGTSAKPRGVDEFRLTAGATPGPLDVELGCGALLHVDALFRVDGWTKLSVVADAPAVPHAEFRVNGRTKFNLKVTPMGEPQDCDSGPVGIVVWQEPEFD